MKVLIVSRHPSTQKLLASILDKHGFEYDIVDHVDDVAILNKYDVIIGNVPLSLFVKATVQYYIQVNLEIPKELRGKELDVSELSKYVSYIVFDHIVKWWDGHINCDIKHVNNIDEILEKIKG